MNTSASPSQHSTSPPGGNAQLFVDEAGLPLRIFVESNGIHNNRPKLIRTLRNYGASICVDVSAARIIIVNPNSSEGQFYVNEWGSDSGKVVLSVTWVSLCLQQGRALMEKDGWGGCDKIDGMPLHHETEGDGDALFYANSGALGLNGTQPVHPQTQHASVPSGHLGSMLAPMQQSTPAEFGAPKTQIPQHFAPPSSQTPFPPSFSAQHQPPLQFSQNGLPQLPNMAPNMVTSFGQLVPQSQFNMNNMNPQMLSSQMQQAIMSNPELMAAAAAMLMAGGMAGGGSFMPPQWQGLQPFMPLQSQGFPMTQPQPQHLQAQNSIPSVNTNGYSTDATGVARDASPAVKNEEQTPGRSSSPLPTFTTVGDSDSDGSPSPTQSILRQRGRKRHRESSRSISPVPTNRPETPSGSHKKKRDTKRTSFLFEDATNHSLPLSENQPQTIGIFTHKNGKPMTFFIQVQMRNRQNVIRQIKANGGKIEADAAKADFILLDTQSGKDRDQWMKSVKSLNCFALAPSFVEACIDANGIVEEEDFIIESKKDQRRNKRAMSPESEDHENGSTEAIDQEPVSRSPSPPPISKIPSGGRANYTVQEIEYALLMAKHCIRRDHRIGFQQIGNELARKAPRHTMASWATVLYKDVHREELEQFRDTCRQGRKKRKTSSANALNGSSAEVEAQLTQPNESTPARASTTAEPARLNGSTKGPGQEFANDIDSSDPHEADLKTIVDFFVAPPDGVTEDDVLWRILSGKHACRTRPDWQAFYEANREAVDSRLEDALADRAEVDAQ